MLTTVHLKTRANSYDGASLRQFRAATAIVNEALMKANVTKGEFFIAPREKQKWKAGQNNSMCLRPGQGREVRIRVKIVGNDSVWDYSLVPDSKDIDIEWVRQSLEASLGPEQVDLQPADEAPPEEIRAGQAFVEIASQAPKANPIAVLDRLRDAVARREDAMLIISVHRSTAADIGEQIKEKEKEREECLMAALVLEEKIENDADYKLARQFIDLLGQLA